MNGNPSTPPDPPLAGNGAPFSLSDQLDREAARTRFASTGRVQLGDFLAGDGAARLLAHLRGRPDWKLIFNQDDHLFELDRAGQAALTPVQKSQLEASVYKNARERFQYLYETLRVPDGRTDRASASSLLNDFADFMASPAVLGLLRDIIDAPDIRFADAQATAYSPGHFLTSHDDAVAGKARRAAYVLNLSVDWRLDWGGLLTFEGDDGHVSEAFVPRFGALNLFQVPTRHAVSCVAPFAPWRRYSVTGWLRAIDPPA